MLYSAVMAPRDPAVLLLERLLEDPDAGFASVLAVASRLTPADQSAAVAQIRARLDRLPAAERVVSAHAHDPIFWPLAGVLAIEGPPRDVVHDLSHLDGVVLRAPQAAWVDTLARQGDPSRWRTLRLEPGRRARVLDALLGLPLDALEHLTIRGPSCDEASIRKLARLPAPALRKVTLVQAGAPAREAFEALAEIPGLRELDVVSTAVGDGAAGVIAGLHARLEVLKLAFAELSTAAVRVLCRRPWPLLHTLELVDARRSRGALPALIGAARRFPMVRELSLGHVTDGELVKLAASGWLVQLRSLGLGAGESRIGDRAALALLAASAIAGPVINDGLIEQLMASAALGTTPAKIEALARAPGLLHVRWLTLPRLSSARAAEALAASPYAANVERLMLPGCALPGAALGALLRAMPRLVELELHGPHPRVYRRGERYLPLAPAMIDTLAESGLRLRRLELPHTGVDDGAIARIADAGVLASVEELDLSGCPIGEPGLARVLAAAPRLNTLDLRGARIGPGAGACIAAASQRFRHLGLAQVGLRDAGLDALLASPRLDALESLSLAANRLSAVSAERLVARFGDGSPRMLDMSANEFGAHGLALLEALAARPLWDGYGGVAVHHDRGPRRPLGPAPRWVPDGQLALALGEWAFAGTFALGSHGALVARARSLGARAQRSLRPSTEVLAVGARPGRRLARAVARGLPLVTEAGLYRVLGVSLEEALDAELAAAARAPHPASWNRVAEALDRWPDATVDGRVRALSAAPLEGPIAVETRDGWRWRWTNERRAPRRWITRAAKGEPEPRLLACNTLVIGPELSDEALARLFARPELALIRVARVDRLRAEPPQVFAPLPALVDLRVRGALDPVRGAALGRATIGPGLERLSWEAGEAAVVREGGARPEASAIVLPSGLRALSWAPPLQGAALEALFGAPWPRLEDLALTIRSFEASAAGALRGARAPSLRRVSLAIGDAPQEILRALFEAPSAAELTHAALHLHAVTEKTLGAWAESPFAREGACLVLRAASVRGGERGVERLRARGVRVRLL